MRSIAQWVSAIRLRRTPRTAGSSAVATSSAQYGQGNLGNFAHNASTGRAVALIKTRATREVTLRPG
ncbi:hypothetical protein L5I01_05015 [Gordonia sp. HY442]|uniref:hypothetical protein n=1 Tax=Gordonia zhenghanii TaxID=2911516 RepID=UPI001F37635A|nr:hypothetical protein [Gordonia zhenghanii]MCF8602718.1 hypothetical protein [Gordonia zhenghanii]